MGKMRGGLGELKSVIGEGDIIKRPSIPSTLVSHIENCVYTKTLISQYCKFIDSMIPKILIPDAD